MTDKPDKTWDDFLDWADADLDWQDSAYPLKVKFKKVHSDAQIPTKAHPTDAGWDFYSTERMTIAKGSTVKVGTGIAASIPEGYCGYFAERSGLGFKNIKVSGGVIDSSYCGEMQVILHYLMGDGHYPPSNQDFFLIEKGAKVAQMLILPVPVVEWEEVQDLDETDRGEKGFGSSGK